MANVVFGGTKIPNIFCSCMDEFSQKRCEDDKDPLKADCRPYVLVDPQELAKVEEQAKEGEAK